MDCHGYTVYPKRQGREIIMGKIVQAVVTMASPNGGEPHTVTRWVGIVPTTEESAQLMAWQNVCRWIEHYGSDATTATFTLDGVPFETYRLTREQHDAPAPDGATEGTGDAEVTANVTTADADAPTV